MPTPELPKSPEPDPSSPAPRDPEGEQLLAAHMAFDQGDFLATRRTLEVLLRANPPEPVRTKAEALKQRCDTDKVSIYLAVACLLLFLSVAITYLR